MKKALLIGLFFSMFCGCHHPEANNSQQTSTKVDSTATAVVAFLNGDNEATTVRYLDTLPADYDENDLFGLILDYKDLEMIVTTWKMPDNDWLITYHWCDLEDGFEDAEDAEDAVAVYEDPFEGKPYPVLHNPDFSFVTRNYGGETINFYKTADSQEVASTTDYKEISLQVLDVDPKTRRILVQSNPKDWCWGEVEEEWQEGYRHPFVELRGWVDEEWVCANTVTTCP